MNRRRAPVKPAAVAAKQAPERAVPAQANPARSNPARSNLARSDVPRERFSAWREQHLYCLLSSLGRLWQRRGATALTTLVLAFALSLPLAYYVAFENVRTLSSNLSVSREIGVFAKPGLDGASLSALTEKLGRLENVANVAERSPEQGLADLKALPGFDAALAELPANPLPALLIVTPIAGADHVQIEALAQGIRGDASVDAVQVDLTWRERLDRIIALADRLGWVLAVLFALGALLVVGNTVRLDVAQQADEIRILQLLGGTRGFVRRPYLYLGCWYGLAAATLALFAVEIGVLALSGPAADLARSYGAGFSLRGLDFSLLGKTVGAGIVLGWIGAFIATSRYETSE